ncbi:MAG: DUF433 domain-containing protein [Cyanobacteria bacterium J06626_18]
MFTRYDVYVKGISANLNPLSEIDVSRVTFDPKIMAGQACVRGLRVTVSLVLKLVASGKTTDEIIEDYPYREAGDIQQALQYAAWLAPERVFVTTQT